MEKIRYFIALSFFAIVPLAMYQCGGSDTGADDDEEETEAGSSDVATATASASAFNDSLGSSTAAADESVSALIKMGVKNQSVDIPAETITMDCPSGGTMDITTSGTAEVDGESFSLDLTSTTSFSDCVYAASVTQDDGTTCDYSATIDGAITCTLIGNVESIDFACTTSGACEGINVTLNGEAHTGGVNIGVDNFDAMGGGEPTFTGAVCIDGDTFTAEELADMEVPEGELTCL